jgi:hypothetical protein
MVLFFAGVLDSLDDFRQLIFALQSPPGFCGRDCTIVAMGQLQIPPAAFESPETSL